MQENNENPLYTSNVIACVWDFDKTLIDGYMQSPIFEEYDVDEALFWKEVNMLPEIYAKKGVRVSPESVYLNHLLSFVKNGLMRGLSNKKLHSHPKIPSTYSAIFEPRIISASPVLTM